MLIEKTLKKINDIFDNEEEWGQLDYYDQFPVQLPCTLIECESVDYTNTNSGQQPEALITVSISNTQELQGSSMAPGGEEAFEIFNLLNAVNNVVSGLQVENSRQLISVRMLRVRRDDAIREFRLSYKIRFSDI